MSTQHPTTATRLQFQSPPPAWLRWALLSVGAAVVVVQLVVIAHRRATHGGDFDISREFGRRFLAGEPLYAGGLHYPYMPSAAMFFSPLALVGPSLGIALRYAAALGCLWLTLGWLHAMRGWPAPRFTIDALALALGSHYLIRDLDDGGPHLMLLAMLVGGMSCAEKGHERLGATWFGLATAIKAPSALFVPFFLWKKQWRLAAWTVLATFGWIALPAVWMGPASWWAHQCEWAGVAAGSVFGRRAPVAEESEVRIQDQALRPALLRYLVTYPEGHALRLPQRADVPILDLEPVTAERVASGIMLGLLAACAWRFRAAYRSPASREWLVQCSAVLILELLFSPVTWVQHMVLLLPALFLIASDVCAGGGLGTPLRAAMALYVILSVVLNREILGRDRYLLLLSYHTQTLCMLLVLAVILLRQPAAGQTHGRD